MMYSARRPLPPGVRGKLNAMDREVPGRLRSVSRRSQLPGTRPLAVWLLDAGSRQILVCARELGRAGYRVGAIDRSAHVSTFSSRWCERSVVVPDFSERPDAFIDAVLAVLDQQAAPVVIPGHDGSIAALRRRRAEIERLAALALPEERVLDIAVDKGRTLALAAGLGIAVPTGMPVLEPADLPAALREVGLPTVVKPMQSWVEKTGSGTRLAASVAVSRDEAARTAGQILEAGGQAMLQRWLPGDREAVSLFVAGGRVLARFAQVAHRMYPSLGGASVLRESIPLPDAATEAAQRLIGAIGLEGYAEVEFRRDAEGRPVLMEVNPRLSASVEIAVRAGINFPLLLYQWAAGEPLRPVDGYRTGLRMRWLGGDLRWLRENLCCQGRPDIVPRRVATQQFLLDFLRPAAYDYLDLADLGPAVVATGGFLFRAPRVLGRSLTQNRT
jgi:predicted ATP-grasp superfamily ATP-dependent carboligase